MPVAFAGMFIRECYRYPVPATFALSSALHERHGGERRREGVLHDDVGGRRTRGHSGLTDK